MRGVAFENISGRSDQRHRGTHDSACFTPSRIQPERFSSFSCSSMCRNANVSFASSPQDLMLAGALENQAHLYGSGSTLPPAPLTCTSLTAFFMTPLGVSWLAMSILIGICRLALVLDVSSPHSPSELTERT